jgi:hypothetical protein
MMRKSLVYLLTPVAVMLIGVILLTAFDWDAAAWIAGIGFIAFAFSSIARSFGLWMFNSDVPDDV